MRIRKYAAKLLLPFCLPTTHSSPTKLTSTTTAAGAFGGTTTTSTSSSSSTTLAAVGTGYESPLVVRPLTEPIVCHLNMSPWDLISPEDYFQDHRDQRQEGKTEVVSSVMIVNGRRRSTSSSAVSGRTQIQRNHRLKTGKINQEEKDLKKPTLKRNKKKGIGWKKQTVTWATTKDDAKYQLINEEEQQNLTTTTVTVDSPARGETTICKKTDGKGWHCKRRAKHPHALCDYHLSQIRAYYHATHVLQPRETKTSLPSGTSAKKKEKSKADRDDGPEFYYYYNGFGPWRGKRRGGGERKDVDKNGCYTGTVLRGSAEEGSDDEVDPESIDGLEEYVADEGTVKKRKGRKVIKARSLKSLL